jgi:uncharacterized Zn finger protein (UPF0148 family)
MGKDEFDKEMERRFGVTKDMTTCPECGSDFLFCPKCGEAICPKCGVD